MLRSFKIFKMAFDKWVEVEERNDNLELAQDLLINMKEKWEDYLNESNKRWVENPSSGDEETQSIYRAMVETE